MNAGKYVLDVGEIDLHRMTLLGDIYKPYTTLFIEHNGLRSGMHVADVGCGPGNMSLWFADQVGTSGSVTAIDSSSEQLNILKSRLQSKNITHVLPKKLDVYELSKHFNQQFDVVYCRFFLIHLQDPVKAIHQLKKILKPNGRLIIAELDNYTWYSYPENSYLQRDIDLLCQLAKRRGIDLSIGKKLYAHFKALQLNDININIAQPVLTEKEHREYMIFKIQTWGKKYLEHQLINQNEFEELLNNFRALALNEDYLLLGARMFQIAGTN